MQANSTLGRLSWAVILLQEVSVGFSTCLANVAVRVAEFAAEKKDDQAMTCWQRC